jgi:hypothetical protein
VLAAVPGGPLRTSNREAAVSGSCLKGSDPGKPEQPLSTDITASAAAGPGGGAK